MRVFLILPRIPNDACGDPPLGLAYLASSLRQKFDDLKIEILDMAYYRSLEGVILYLNKKRPDIVGVYLSTPTFGYGREIIRAAKAGGAYVVAGGPHATLFPESLLIQADAVVVGEGEATFTEIISSFIKQEAPVIKGAYFKHKGSIIRNIDRDPISDLDSIPYPARDILDMEGYIANCHYFDAVDMNLRASTMLSSRGCPFSCSYCQPTLDEIFGKGIRSRSPQGIIAEINYLRKEYSIDAVFFHDDAMIFDRKRLNNFLEMLITDSPGLIWGCNSRADLIDEASIDTMYQAGLRCLHIGAESASQRVLDHIYQKKITLVDIRRAVKLAKARGIRTMCFFMLGAPTETREEIEQTIAFSRELGLDEAVFNITSPLPKTYLYDFTKKLGLDISSDWADFNYYSRSAYRNARLNLRQLKYLQFKALAFFYLSIPRLKYILRHLSSIKAMRKLLRKIRRFI